MATTTTKTERDGLAVIAGVTLLLDVAAERCLSILAAGPAPALEHAFALSDLGLGASLVADQARDLLPAGFKLGASSRHPDDPLELVRAAEALTRTVPIDTLPAGSSHLVVALCDLLRKHA